MPQLLAFTLLALILWIGDIVSTRARSWLPSVFVCALLFLAGYWTFFPEDIVQTAGFQTPIVFLAMYLLITNMGTLLSVEELGRQWRTVVIALSGIGGILALLFTVGLTVLDWQTIVVGAPPLVGGVVASLIMSQAAADAGLQALSVLAILIYVMQGFAGYPLTAIMLKREGRRVLAAHRASDWHAPAMATETAEAPLPPRLFASMPAAYDTAYFKMLRLGAVAFAAWGTSALAAPVVTLSPFVLCLVFGVVATSVGFLEREPLRKANAFGFTVLILMVFIFDGLKRATPEMLGQLIVPLVAIIGIGLLGMYLASWIVGRLLGVTPAMAFACSLTALYGFPADYIITKDVIDTLTDDAAEREALTAHLLPPMLVAGFVTVTMVSVVLAGIFVGMIA
ncbi:hypothetical protein E4L95_04005 [Paracoccus liaowanqingii]|uniref:Na+/glutamate symporter n=1 Tax=Paracoccus liaowanqingii TaxID=2560053 RepID=A0A4Z1CRC2_9RHOB|nr:hypothetical protein [Paracoccus liaowanqingii]TGN67717.1 hypothetical protein E4L95_04005 [Paracoccus liaowanqingii]